MKTKLRIAIPRLFQNENKSLGHLELWDADVLLLRLRTVELPWKENQRGISCIKADTYTGMIHHSPKHGWSLWLQDVDGRSEILVHAASYVRQLEGCIAPGLFHKDIDNDGIIDVSNSRDAMKILKVYLGDRKYIEVKITDPPKPQNWVERYLHIPNALKRLLKI